MNIKSLILGSAAALVAVSGARAADAVVVAEPEPMEYVRICDVYGAGFYYIPGTETCLKVGGYLRYDIGVGKGGYGGLIDVTDKKDLAEAERSWEAGYRDYASTHPNVTRDDYAAGVNARPTYADIKTNDSYYKRARAALQLDARSETELGTLRGYMHINFNWDTVVDEDDFRLTNTATDISIEHAYIELGGFRIGRTDSMFSTFTNYAGNVIEDDLVLYGPMDTHQIAYTYVGTNGFSASVALEEGSGDVLINQAVSHDADGNLIATDFSLPSTIDSYAPHVVVGAAVTQGWGGVSGVVGYDSNFEEWTGKARLDVNATEQISLFIMAGYGSQKNSLRNFYKDWGGKWAVWGGGTYKFNEKASVNLQASYSQNKDTAVVANVAYDLVPGFTITPEVAWNSVHTDVTREKIADGFGGFLRFQRSF
jgi:opacity protein-like surface antigen